MTETEHHFGHGINGNTEAHRSLREHNAQHLLGDHKSAGVAIGGQRPDRLLGFSSQGGKKEPHVQTAEKASLRRACPHRHHSEDPGKGLESSQQTKKHEGWNGKTVPSDVYPQKFA